MFCSIRELAPDETALHLRRERIRYSLEDAEEVALCEAAGAHCLDAYELPEGAANFIRIADGFFQGEPLAEYLSGLHGPESSDAFDWIEAMERRPRQRSQVPAAADLRDQLSSFRRVGEGERARARGYRCASAARRFLDLTRRDRLPSVEEVANRFEAPEFETPPTSRGLRALVSSVSEIVNVHLSDTVLRQGKTAWLFALGRALGEGLANPTAPRAVVNDLRNASRQAANRAFAGAFLAPLTNSSPCEKTTWKAAQSQQNSAYQSRSTSGRSRISETLISSAALLAMRLEAAHFSV